MVILAYSDPNKEYRLYTEASYQSIGISKMQPRWSTIEKVAYAIDYAIQKQHSPSNTDYRPLEHLFNLPIENRHEL